MIVEPPSTTRPGLHVAPERPGDALGVDAAVREEAPVLDRDRRLREPGRDLPERDDLPVALGRDHAEQRAVGGVDERVLADLRLLERGEVAARAEREHRAARGDAGSRAEDGRDRRAASREPPAPCAAGGGAGEAALGPADARAVGASCSSCGDGSHGLAQGSARAAGRLSVIVAPCAAPSQRRGRRSGSSSGAGSRSGRSPRRPCSPSRTSSTAARDAGTRPRLHELGAAVDVWARWDSDWYLRIAEYGLRLAVEHAGVLPALSAARRRARPCARRTVPPRGPRSSRSPPARSPFVAPLPPRRGTARDAPTRAGRCSTSRVFPTSLFLGAVYGESLFLALAVGTFVLAERGRLGWASVDAGLALLTRAQGIALLPALAVFAWRSGRRRDARAAARAARAVRARSRSRSRLWIGHGLGFVDAQRRLGALARAARPARRARPGGRRGRRRRPGARGRDARARRRRLAAARRAVRPLRDLRARAADGAAVRAARRALLVPALRARRVPVPRRARGPRSRPSRRTSSSSRFSARGSRSTWFDGRCGTGSPDGGSARPRSSAGRSSSAASRCSRTRRNFALRRRPARRRPLPLVDGDRRRRPVRDHPRDRAR